MDKEGCVSVGIPVRLEAFEGPLDLLLHLIDKNKINIYDIPIVEITDQYLEYVNAMDKQDLNVVSEFLVMAATLLDIKSRMLLPKQVDENGEEEDPRAELVAQLLEYKMYKYMSYELKDRQLDGEKSMYKPSTVPVEVAKYEPPVDLGELLGDLTLVRLKSVFDMVMKKQEDKLDPIRSKFGKIEKEEVNLPQKMQFIVNYVFDKKECSFQELLLGQSSKMQIIVTFLAVLELMKISKISIVQEEIFDDIIITANEESGRELPENIE